jgi:hypothetical protein
MRRLRGFEDLEMQRTFATVTPMGSRWPPALDSLVARNCERPKQLKQKLDALF